MKGFYNADNSKPPSESTVFINQLKYNPKLKRISPCCEGCGQIHSYHIHSKRVSGRNNNFLEVIFSRKIRYYISCPECSFAMELDYDEYKELKKIAKQNKEDGRS